MSDKSGEPGTPHPSPKQDAAQAVPRLDPNSPAWLAARRRSRKRILLLAGFAAIVCGSIYTYWSTGAGEDEAGVKAYEEKKYDEAIAHFTRAIRGNPKNVKAYVGRSLAYLEKREWRKAFEDSSYAIHLNPQLCLGYTAKASALANMKRLGRAIETLNEAIHHDPKCASAYYYRARFVYEQAPNDFTRPLADLAEAVRIDPNLAAAYSLEGQIRYDAKEYDKAFAAATKALDLNAEDARAHLTRGLVLLRRHKEAEGQAEIDRAVQLDHSLQKLFEPPKKPAPPN